MQVVAIAMGFHAGSRRRKGAQLEYDLKEGANLPSWVVPVGKAPKAEAAAPREPVALSQMSSQTAQSMAQVLGPAVPATASSGSTLVDAAKVNDPTGGIA